ncbi:MAG: hypothetical protein ACKOED_08105 [Aestuariivirga sp.]
MAKAGTTPLLVLGAAFGVVQVTPGAEKMAGGIAEWIKSWTHVLARSPR